MTYLATTLYINKLYQEQGPKIALGEDGIADSIVSGIKDLVKWDSNNILASIMGFMGPGILWTMGMPWMAITYEVAGALGVDWIKFWSSLGGAVWDIVKGTLGSVKPTESELFNKVAEVTKKVFDANTTDTVDEERLANAMTMKAGDPIPKGASINESDFDIVKEAGILGTVLKSTASKTRGMLSSFFTKVIPWLVTRALASVGLAVGVGAATGLLGINPSAKKEDGAGEGSADEPASTAYDPIHKLPMSKSVDPDLFEFHRNDGNATWVEKGNINDIISIIAGWISSAYPELMQGPERDKVINSDGFKAMVAMFQKRNQGAQILPIYIVPTSSKYPIERKIDVVSAIVNKYLKTRGK